MNGLRCGGMWLVLVLSLSLAKVQGADDEFCFAESVYRSSSPTSWEDRGNDRDCVSHTCSLPLFVTAGELCPVDWLFVRDRCVRFVSNNNPLMISGAQNDCQARHPQATLTSHDSGWVGFDDLSRILYDVHSINQGCELTCGLREPQCQQMCVSLSAIVSYNSKDIACCETANEIAGSTTDCPAQTNGATTNNGANTIQGGSLPQSAFGATGVAVACPGGAQQQRNGLSYQYDCGAGGVWSPAIDAVCENECPGINIPNSGATNTPIPFGDDGEASAEQVIFCDTGFSMVGATAPATFICSAGNGNYDADWTAVTCHMDCGAQANDGATIPDITASNHGDFGVVTCPQAGYSLEGSATATCTDGSFSGQGSCKQDCAAQPQSGVVPAISAAANLATGTVSCPNGTLQGSPSATCNDGSFSGQGSCMADCAGQANDGASLPEIAAVAHNQNAAVSCPQPGYTLDGGSTAFCHDGVYDAHGTCKADCPAQSEAGTTPAITATVHLGIGTVSCSGTLNGSDNASCTDGVFTGQGSCEAPVIAAAVFADCAAQPGDGVNAPAIAAASHMAVGAVSCPQADFSLEGSATANCTDGVFTGQGTCLKDCLVQLEAGEVPRVEAAAHGDTGVAVSCPSGATLSGSDEAICSDGVFSGFGTCLPPIPCLGTVEGKGLSGNDIGPLYNVTLAECFAECAALGDCAGAAYRHLDHTCNLKTNITHAGSGHFINSVDIVLIYELADCTTTAAHTTTVATTTTNPCVTIVRDHEMSGGNDVRGENSPTMEGCGALCEAEPECRAALYRHDSGVCWLKHTVNPLNFRLNSSVIIMTCRGSTTGAESTTVATAVQTTAAEASPVTHSPAKETITPNRGAIGGHDITGGVFVVPSEEQCFEDCQAHPLCKSACLRPSDLFCILKSTADASAMLSDVTYSVLIDQCQTTTAVPTSAAPAPSPCMGAIEGKAHSASNLQTLTNMTMEECVAACRADANCAGAVYRLSIAECNLKTAIDPAQMSDDASATILFELADCASPEGSTKVIAAAADMTPCLLALPGVAIGGHDLPAVPGYTASMGQCFADCLAHPLCKSAAFQDSQTHCVLKSTADPAARSTHLDYSLLINQCEAATTPGPPTSTAAALHPCIQAYPNQGLGNDPLAHFELVQPVSLAECADLCLASPNCTVAAYNQDATECRLKNSADPLAALKNSTARIALVNLCHQLPTSTLSLGIVPSAQPSPVGPESCLDYFNDTRIFVPSLRTIYNVSTAACTEDCEADPLCTAAVSWQNKTCYLKNISDPFPQATADEKYETHINLCNIPCLELHRNDGVPGSTIATVTGTASIAECWSRCLAEPLCTAAVRMHGQGNCLLKNGTTPQPSLNGDRDALINACRLPTTTEDPLTSLGTVTTPSSGEPSTTVVQDSLTAGPCLEVFSDTRIPTPNYREIANVSASYCADECLADPFCTGAVSWRDTNCFLKNSSDLFLHLTPFNNYEAMIDLCKDPCMELTLNSNIPHAGFAQPASNSMAECWSLCLAEPLCTSAARIHATGICSLKNKTSPVPRDIGDRDAFVNRCRLPNATIDTTTNIAPTETTGTAATEVAMSDQTEAQVSGATGTPLDVGAWCDSVGGVTVIGHCFAIPPDAVQLSWADAFDACMAFPGLPPEHRGRLGIVDTAEVYNAVMPLSVEAWIGLKTTDGIGDPATFVSLFRNMLLINFVPMLASRLEEGRRWMDGHGEATGMYTSSCVNIHNEGTAMIPSLSDKECVRAKADGKWEDGECTDTFVPLCEILPGTLVTLQRSCECAHNCTADTSPSGIGSIPERCHGEGAGLTCQAPYQDKYHPMSTAYGCTDGQSSSGVWDHSCVLFCHQVFSPDGKHSLPQTKSGEVATLVCLAGYEDAAKPDNTTANCINGTFDMTLINAACTWAEPDCPDIAIGNSDSADVIATVPFGSSETATCHAGRSMEGGSPGNVSVTLTCLAGGVYDKDPTTFHCLSDCLETVQVGAVPSASSAQHWTKGTLSCTEGLLVGPVDYDCVDGGHQISSTCQVDTTQKPSTLGEVTSTEDDEKTTDGMDETTSPFVIKTSTNPDTTETTVHTTAVITTIAPTTVTTDITDSSVVSSGAASSTASEASTPTPEGTSAVTTTQAGTTSSFIAPETSTVSLTDTPTAGNPPTSTQPTESPSTKFASTKAMSDMPSISTTVQDSQTTSSEIMTETSSSSFSASQEEASSTATSSAKETSVTQNDSTTIFSSSGIAYSTSPETTAQTTPNAASLTSSDHRSSAELSTKYSTQESAGEVTTSNYRSSTKPSPSPTFADDTPTSTSSSSSAAISSTSTEASSSMATSSSKHSQSSSTINSTTSSDLGSTTSSEKIETTKDTSHFSVATTSPSSGATTEFASTTTTAKASSSFYSADTSEQSSTSEQVSSTSSDGVTTKITSENTESPSESSESSQSSLSSSTGKYETSTTDGSTTEPALRPTDAGSDTTSKTPSAVNEEASTTGARTAQVETTIKSSSSISDVISSVLGIEVPQNVIEEIENGNPEALTDWLASVPALPSAEQWEELGSSDLPENVTKTLATYKANQEKLEDEAEKAGVSIDEVPSSMVSSALTSGDLTPLKSWLDSIQTSTSTTRKPQPTFESLGNILGSPIPVAVVKAVAQGEPNALTDWMATEGLTPSHEAWSEVSDLPLENSLQEALADYKANQEKLENEANKAGVSVSELPTNVVTSALESGDLEPFNDWLATRKVTTTDKPQMISKSLADILGVPIPASVAEAIAEGEPDALTDWMAEEGVTPSDESWEEIFDLPLENPLRETLADYKTNQEKLDKEVSKADTSIEELPSSVVTSALKSGDIDPFYDWLASRQASRSTTSKPQPAYEPPSDESLGAVLGLPIPAEVANAIADRPEALTDWMAAQGITPSDEVWEKIFELPLEVALQDVLADYKNNQEKLDKAADKTSVSVGDIPLTVIESALKSGDLAPFNSWMAARKTSTTAHPPSASELLSDVLGINIPATIAEAIDQGQTKPLTDWMAAQSVRASYEAWAKVFDLPLEAPLNDALTDYHANQEALDTLSALADIDPAMIPEDVKASILGQGNLAPFTDWLGGLNHSIPEDTLEKLAAEQPDVPEDVKNALNDFAAATCQSLWAQWSEWPFCPVTCGRGEEKRRRLRTLNADACPADEDMRFCNQAFCPEDCLWSSWGRWGSCSVSCGAGRSQRFRLETKEASNGGRECQGPNQETRNCTSDICQDPTVAPETMQELSRAGIDVDGPIDPAAISAAATETIPFYLANLTTHQRLEYGHQLLDTIPLCTFDGRQCAPDDFETFVDNSLGNCFTFNYRESVRHWTKRPGAQTGLKLLLHSDQSEYLCVSQTSGFRVVVHKQGETPFPDTQGISVPLALVSSLAVTLTKSTKLPPPYGDCTESADKYDEYIYDGNFTTEGCLRSCGQNILTQQCGCADPRYKLPNGSNPCPLSEKTCLDFYHSCDDYGIASMCNHCTMPCQTDVFAATMSSTRLKPTVGMSRVCPLLASGGTSCATKESKMQNFARLDIYYDRLNQITFEETPDYGGTNLISDIAGVMGITLGLSCITALEFGMALVSLVVHGVSRGSASLLQGHQ